VARPLSEPSGREAGTQRAKRQEGGLTRDILLRLKQG